MCALPTTITTRIGGKKGACFRLEGSLGPFSRWQTREHASNRCTFVDENKGVVDSPILTEGEGKKFLNAGNSGEAAQTV